jgi:predicted TPR repeat methyltransferase
MKHGRVAEALAAAETAAAAGDRNGAIEELTAALLEAPDDTDLLLLRGRQQLALGQAVDAAADFTRVTTLAPNNPDGHYRLAMALRDQQKLGEAAASYRRALALAPAHAEAHNNLGAVLQLQGRLAEALAAFRQAIALDPVLPQPRLNLGRLLEVMDDRAGAAAVWRDALAHLSGEHAEPFRHLLDAAEGRTSARAPAAYTRTLFNDFALHFDARLEGELHYRVPEVIMQQLGTVRAAGSALTDVLDLGCGTGLCAVALQGHGRFVGVDLSPAMLAQARARKCYDELIEADVLDYLRESAPERYGLVVAADVFIYLGDLAEAFAGIARVLRPGGWFAFSIETCAPDAGDYALLASGRYAQSAAYIRRLAAASGLRERSAHPLDIRGAPGHAIAGCVFVLEKP